MTIQQKPRILIVNEFSELNTGFSTYMHYVLPRLYATDKYEVAELATYANETHPKAKSVPWKVYFNEPHPNDQEARKSYDSNRDNQFGRFRFEEVCIDFKPDIILTIRDPWMDMWISESPLRDNFLWIEMPTVDGEPQKQEWLDIYRECDVITTYSLWGANLLEKQTRGEVSPVDVTSPGADIEIFHPPESKESAKQSFGLRPDTFIFQTVMRNQPRKLFPDLLNAFNRYLDICKENNNQELANNSYLYFHTGQPDVGWDMTEEIRKYKLSHKVLFTYVCDRCKSIYPAFYSGEQCLCRRCKQHMARIPNSSNGVSREELAKIMQAADVYIQYSVCLAKNQEILTNNGWKFCQDITSDDMVWTHKHRWMPIIAGTITPNTIGKALKIDIHSDYETLIGLANHPVLAYTNIKTTKNVNIRTHLGTLIRANRTLPEPTKVELKDLKVGDLLVYPIDDTIQDLDYININGFNVPLNENNLKAIGLFAADGSAHGGRITITCNLDEIENQQIATNFFEEFAGNKKVENVPYNGRHATDIRILDTNIKNQFSEWFKIGLNKKLPDWVMHLPIEKHKFILQGLCLGDGHYSKGITVYCTISKSLAEQIKFILRRLRINYNVHIDPKNTCKDGRNRQPQYRFEIIGNIQDGECISKRSSTHNLYVDNTYLLKIKSIKEIEYNDEWYNFEVANDHTYTTKLGINYNCEGWSMPPNDAKACGVPSLLVNYSAMAEQAHNGGGLPIKVLKFYQEPLHQTNQLRAIPDNQHCAEQMYLLATDKNLYNKLSEEARECVEKYYSWDIVANKWENIFDNLELKDRKKTWQHDLKLIKPNLNIPNNLSNEQFIAFLYSQVMQKPEKVKSAQANRYLNALNLGYQNGCTPDGKPLRLPVTREQILNVFLQYVNNYNNVEQYRFNVMNNINTQPKHQELHYAEI